MGGLLGEIFSQNSLPPSLSQLENLKILNLDKNPLNPELKQAYKQGVPKVLIYLRAKSKAQITLSEAKLILIGEGEVGKTCLMDALLGKRWQEHPSTHGIEIQQFKIIDQSTKKEITFNGWDFGGQRIYRPTHQLFFSAPAVYLVVWKPREGSQAGQIKEWIQLIKRREPSAKILVVATHGGPLQSQPDVDRQELWDLFGKETIVDFLSVDSKPDEQGNRKGIENLKISIAKIAAKLPEVGRTVPANFIEVLEALRNKGVPYLPLKEVLAICRAHNMEDETASLFLSISHQLGHLTHYENNLNLRDIVILHPDWLATAISYVLEDKETRDAHGLVKFSRLSQLWNNPNRPEGNQYDKSLHYIFLRLMEYFDISYRVAGLSKDNENDPISLIAQLVPDTTPENDDFNRAWTKVLAAGDIQQTQICRIVDAQNGQSANAEGLFFQLIVRLHRFSLGRTHYNDSLHWQRGIILDDDYNGKALLRHLGNDVHITVRAPFPERFLTMLTEEVKYLVENTWEGLKCEVMVPCISPCGKDMPGAGLFNVRNLLESIKEGQPKYPCPTCNKWQNIGELLRNAPSATESVPIENLQYQFDIIKDKLDIVDSNTRRLLSQVDKSYGDLLQILTDEAQHGPRLFSLFPIDRSNFNPKEWIRSKFRLVLWCEHSRLPLPVLNGVNSKKGVYELEIERKWFTKSAPYLKILLSTLGMVLPVATSTTKLILDDVAYKLIEEQLDFGKSIVDLTIKELENIGALIEPTDQIEFEHGVAIRGNDSTLRELHTLLRAKDPSFGDLVRVINKRQEFLWVHEKFANEY